MEQWIPLMGTVIAGLVALGVAIWNSRGESAPLRQLKAMNEVLTGMSASAERSALEDARGALAMRVAAQVLSAPTRRRITWFVIAVILAVAGSSAAMFLLAPTEDREDPAASWVALIVSVVAAVVALLATRASNARTLRRAQEDAETLARLLRPQADAANPNEGR